MSNKNFFLNGLSAIFLFSCLTMYSCTDVPEQDGEQAEQTNQTELTHVKARNIIKKSIPLELEWLATIEGNTTAQIRAKVSGYLTKQNYQEGSLVKKGDILFEIDPRPFQATLEQAQGDLKQAEALWTTSKANLEKIRPLAKISAVSKADLDNAIGAEQSSSAKVIAAKAAVDSAKLNLEYTKIIAPIDGLVGVAKAQIGDLVGSQTISELTTMSSVDPVRIFVPITEQQYLKAALLAEKKELEGKGDKEKELQFRLFLTGDIEYPKIGYAEFADRQIDPTTGTIKLAISFPNPNNILRPGMSAKIRTSFNSQEKAMLVPSSVITTIQGLYNIMVIDADNIIHIRNVQLGKQLDNYQVITEGLEENDRIVINESKAITLKEGDKVSVEMIE